MGYKGGEMTSVFENRIKLETGLWMGAMCLAAIVLGYMLAENSYLALAGVLAVIGVLLLPYHSKIAIGVSVTTFTAALIVPFFPGRPLFWEFAALLGWSGLVTTICMRRYATDAWNIVVANRNLFLGVIGYFVVLLITMRYRGFGFRIMGGDQMGGRFYFQQMTCAIFPLLFVLCPVKESTLVKLFVAQCVLSATFLISDYAFSVAPKQLYFLLQFFELSGDAANFEVQAQQFGLRRFQSLYVCSAGYLFLLFVSIELRQLFTIRRILWLPVALGLLGVGLLSGHRYLIMILMIALPFCAYSQRFYSMKNVVVSGVVLGTGILFLYGYADRLPLTLQRAVSVLPGISISYVAREDGMGSLETRRIMRRVGMEMMPQYFWLGRGFGRYVDFYATQWDTSSGTAQANQGVFFNGFIGLMVNTGVFGTIFMLTFLFAGTALAWRIMLIVRRQGCGDKFLRMCSVVTGIWMANVIAFLFLHGDSEYAMKTFSLQAGMLLACHYHIKRRERALAVNG